MILVYCLLIALWLLYQFLNKKFAYFEENGIPHVKPSSWIIGNLSNVGSKIHMSDFVRNFYEEFKNKDVIAGFYQMFSPTILVTDPELVKLITVKDFNSFTGRGMYVNAAKEPLTGNLAMVDGDQWKFLRNKLSPAFAPKQIKMIFTSILEKKENLLTAIQTASVKGSLEAKDISKRFTIDATGSSVFGLEVNTLKNENQEFVEIFQEMFGVKGLSSLPSFFLLTFPKVFTSLGMRWFSKNVERFFFKVIGTSIKYREVNQDQNDFLNMIIQLKTKGSIDGELQSDSRTLRFDESVAQLFVFFFGGADSSSTAIAFAITELSCHPEIQERLRLEIIEKTKSTNGEINYENLHEMKYLEQVVNGEKMNQSLKNHKI